MIFRRQIMPMVERLRAEDDVSVRVLVVGEGVNEEGVTMLPIQTSPYLFLRSCWNFFRAERSSLIHVYGWLPWWMMMLGWVVGWRPWIMTIQHVVEMPFYIRWWRGLFYRMTSRIICVSRATQQALHRLYPWTIDRSVVIYPGVNSDTQYAMERATIHDIPQLLVFAEKLVEPLVFLKGLSGVRRPWRLHVIVRATSRPFLVEQGAKLGILPRIRFSEPESSLALLLRQGDFLCLPASRDDQETVALEAAALGIPMIAEEMPIWRELFGEDGMAFVAPSISEEWTRVIERALLEPQQARRRVQAARRKVETEYALSMVTGTHEALYRQIFREYHAG
jgi:glycosyltransferase involved in cell wall biosynthesis